MGFRFLRQKYDRKAQFMAMLSILRGCFKREGICGKRTLNRYHPSTG